MKRCLLSLLLVASSAFAQSRDPRQMIVDDVHRWAEDVHSLSMEQQRADIWSKAFRGRGVVSVPVAPAPAWQPSENWVLPGQRAVPPAPAGAAPGVFNDEPPPGVLLGQILSELQAGRR
jgi:hypothetical protein